MPVVEGDQNFTIRGTSGDFSQRNNNIFGALQGLESQHEQKRECDDKGESSLLWKEQPELPAMPSTSRLMRATPVLNCRSMDYYFKHPQDRKRNHDGKSIAPPRVPDHVLHPERYVEYTLGDVSAEDTSEQGNTAAAMSFLAERRMAREEQQEKEQKEQEKIIFRAPQSQTVAPVDIQDPPASISGSSAAIGHQHRMPEYVVGLSKQQAHKKHLACPVQEMTTTSSTPAGQGNGQVDLSHLEDEEVRAEEETFGVQVGSPTSEKVSFKSGKGKASRSLRKKKDD